MAAEPLSTRESSEETNDLAIRRMGLNDATFRAANEQTADAADALDAEGRLPIICECADPNCTDVILLEREAYAGVRANPRWFVNIPGHQALGVQVNMLKVVEDHGDFVVIEKLGEAAQVAEDNADVKDIHGIR